MTSNIGSQWIQESTVISREEMDEIAVRSHNNVERATNEGDFAEEIVPMETTMLVKDKESGDTSEQRVTLAEDEGPRPDTTLEGLAGLEPVNPGGTVTAGNASQLSDGAAAVLMIIVLAKMAGETALICA